MRWDAGMVFCTSDTVACEISTLHCGIGKMLKSLRYGQPDDPVHGVAVCWETLGGCSVDVR
jgi:hypothetical protein